MKGKVVVGIGVVLCMGGCGGGEKSGGDTTEILSKGYFIDSPVQGLEYSTNSRTGVTGADGGFIYIEGEDILFKIGDIELGSSKGKSVITPIDIVVGATDEMDRKVTNIARFIQTLDNDANPENGITIPEIVLSQAIGVTINFDVDVSEFSSSGYVQTIVSDLTNSFGNGRELVSIDSARGHLSSSLSTTYIVDTDEQLGNYGFVKIYSELSDWNDIDYGYKFVPEEVTVSENPYGSQVNWQASATVEGVTSTMVVNYSRYNDYAASILGVRAKLIYGYVPNIFDTSVKYVYELECPDDPFEISCFGLRETLDKKGIHFSQVSLAKTDDSAGYDSIQLPVFGPHKIGLKGTLLW